MGNKQRLNYQIGPASKTNHLTDAQYIQGGYLSVADLTELNALPVVTYNSDGSIKKDGIIIEGSMAYVRDHDDLYIYQEDSETPGKYKWKPFDGTAISWTYSTEDNDPVNVNVGGVDKGTKFTKATLDDLFDSLFHRDYDPIFTSLIANVDEGEYEYGTIFRILGLIPTYEPGRAALSHLYIVDSLNNTLYDGDVVESGSTITVDPRIRVVLTEPYTITAKLTDESGRETVKTMTFDCKKYNYYCVSQSAEAIPSDFTKYTTESVEITTTDNSYIYIISPEEKSQIQQFALGEWTDIDTVDQGTITFLNEQKQELTYHVYHSVKLRVATNKFRLI